MACYIKDVTKILCHLSTVPESIHVLISLFVHILKLVINLIILAYYFHLSNGMKFTKISLMPIKKNFAKVAHFVVKETHRLHNSVTELDMANLTSCFFQCFVTRPLLITALRYLAFSITSSLDLLKHTKHSLLCLIIPTKFDSEKKNIPITFSRGCTFISVAQLYGCPVPVNITASGGVIASQSIGDIQEIWQFSHAISPNVMLMDEHEYMCIIEICKKYISM